jgi:hypothetical protein
MLSMIEERQRQILLGLAEGASHKKAPQRTSQWKAEQKPSVQPKFKLPPPPHPLPDTVAKSTLVLGKTPSFNGLHDKSVFLFVLCR